MKLWICAKNFFSYFAFFNTERQIRHYQQTFQHREASFKKQIDAKEREIQDLRDRIVALEFEKHESSEEIKKRFEQMNHLQHQLSDAKKECQDSKSKLYALHYTHNHLVRFLQSKQPKGIIRAPVPRHH